MKKIVSTLFPTPETAQRAADDLIDDGAAPDDVSVVPVALAPENDPLMRNHGGPGGRVRERGDRTSKRGAFYGLLLGAALGGLLGFLGAQIPMTVGALTAVAWGLVLGGGAGAIAGLVINGNLPRVTDENYPRTEVEGHTLLRVRVGTLPEKRIRGLLEQHDPLGFDDYAENYDARKRVADATGRETPKGIVAG